MLRVDQGHADGERYDDGYDAAGEELEGSVPGIFCLALLGGQIVAPLLLRLLPLGRQFVLTLVPLILGVGCCTSIRLRLSHLLVRDDDTFPVLRCLPAKMFSSVDLVRLSSARTHVAWRPRTKTFQGATNPMTFGRAFAESRRLAQ
eukprot:scaffold434_cov186-Pinguiococcus_pyrenoidosus.AAC.49